MVPMNLSESAIRRRCSRPVWVGSVKIGGDAPISVQSMTNTRTQDVDGTVGQIERLEAAGCEVVRVAVPDEEAAAAIARIRPRISIPLIADIHFDHRLALAAVRAGADGLRINPGNIGGKKKVREVIQEAKERAIAVRIGVNAGSLEKPLLKKHGGPCAAAMVESALRHIETMGDLDFHHVKISLKASDVLRTVEAYRLMAPLTDLPFHVGVTEAGSRYAGTVKSALGIGMLLAEGIGDTVRVSLTGDPVLEVRIAYEILRALKIRRRGPEIVSCPTCGRCSLDLPRIVDEVEQGLVSITRPVQIAIMGCVVNGPGEAREADLGIAGGQGQGILFKHGKVVRKVPEAQLVEVLLEEVRRLASTEPEGI